MNVSVVTDFITPGHPWPGDYFFVVRMKFEGSNCFIWGWVVLYNKKESEVVKLFSNTFLHLELLALMSLILSRDQRT